MQKGGGICRAATDFDCAAATLWCGKVLRVYHVTGMFKPQDACSAQANRFAARTLSTSLGCPHHQLYLNAIIFSAENPFAAAALTP